MIRLVDVTQHYGVRPVLRQVSLDIETGDLVSVLGPNGMGKTTMLAVMLGAGSAFSTPDRYQGEWVQVTDDRPAHLQEAKGPTISDVLAAAVSGPVERVVCARSYHVATQDYDGDLINERSLEFVARISGAG